MTVASVRAAVEHAVRQGKLSPQQLAAFSLLDEKLSPGLKGQFTELWRAKGSPAAAERLLAPLWLAPALRLIKEFEGCRLEAYKCPAGVWTIGWGSTRLIDQPVRQSDKITQQFADELLLNEVENLFAPGLFTLLPLAKRWRPEQQAALISFAYNVGLGAVEESTLRKRLLAGEDPATVIREELPRWNKGDGGKVLAGLERRRDAEVELFCGGQVPANPLRVPYFSQRDSAVEGQAQRMCFSSSCAMLVAFLRPGSITGPNADDQYLKRVMTFGDSTDAQAQIKALASYGIQARFVQNADWGDIERQINRGVPTPCGFLHHGPSNAPKGGGHWLTVIGYTAAAVIVNDPWGEMSVVAGEYLNSRGGGVAYSRKNWGPRWLVEGPRSGWAIIAEP